MPLDWNTRYALSRAVSLELSSVGLLATTSYSRPARRLELDALPLLLAFAAGAAAREAYSQLAEEWQIDERGFAEAVDQLVDDGFLVAQRQTRARADAAVEATVEPAQGGFASAQVHYHMLNDTVRVAAYRSAIERWSRGRSVVEVGCGTGILSLFAARAGATKVIAIEESGIVEVAGAMVTQNGFESVIELRRANSRDVRLEEPVDVIVHELFGTDPFHEFVLESIDDARRRFLRPGGRLIPYRLEVACLAVELGDSAGRNPEAMLDRLSTLGGLYGLDLSPVSRAVEAMEVEKRESESAAATHRPSMDGARILSAETVLLDIDFQKGIEPIRQQMGRRRLSIERSGRVDALALYFRAHLDEHTVLSTSPSAPPTHWGHDIRLVPQRTVELGQSLEVTVDIDIVQGHPCLKVEPAQEGGK